MGQNSLLARSERISINLFIAFDGVEDSFQVISKEFANSPKERQAAYLFIIK
jgi:hypothetical protein